MTSVTADMSNHNNGQVLEEVTLIKVCMWHEEGKKLKHI